jgi:hypothetical protein
MWLMLLAVVHFSLFFIADTLYSSIVTVGIQFLRLDRTAVCGTPTVGAQGTLTNNLSILFMDAGMCNPAGTTFRIACVLNSKRLNARLSVNCGLLLILPES